MLTIAIFTYKRLDRLHKCIESLDSKNISEILIFNDDETNRINLNNLSLKNSIHKITQIYNPCDFDLKGRQFRKPIYINKAIKFSKNEQILFSDDDGIFQEGAIDMHFNALKKYPFTAGSIIRSRLINRVSKSILQGTNYAFNIDFFNKVGGYDEKFVESMGGGDVDFWYRIYQYTKQNNISVGYIPKAIQKVTSKSKRKKNMSTLDPKEYTLKKHTLNLSGKMYNWFKEIRNKYNWMDVVN
jgi:hypothetical protein